MTSASAAMPGSSPARRGSRSRVGQRADQVAEHRLALVPDDLAGELGLGPGPDDRALGLVQVGEAVEPGPQRGPALLARPTPSGSSATSARMSPATSATSCSKRSSLEEKYR